jgi:hypothetical protein
MILHTPKDGADAREMARALTAEHGAENVRVVTADSGLAFEVHTDSTAAEPVATRTQPVKTTTSNTTSKARKGTAPARGGN